MTEIENHHLVITGQESSMDRGARVAQSVESLTLRFSSGCHPRVVGLSPAPRSMLSAESG